MGKLKMLRPRLKLLDTSIAKVPPKTAEPYYKTPEHIAWRDAVIARAGGRCQAPGCRKAAPMHRMFADHVREIKDGGSPLDVANGQCLCGSHHSLKTNAARAERYAIPSR